VKNWFQTLLFQILNLYRYSPVKEQKDKTPGSVILAKEPEVVANWTRVNGAFTKVGGLHSCVNLCCPIQLLNPCCPIA
jgi:hypothetical protein